jgi:hypothetical protein
MPKHNPKTHGKTQLEIAALIYCLEFAGFSRQQITDYFGFSNPSVTYKLAPSYNDVMPSTLKEKKSKKVYKVANYSEIPATNNNIEEWQCDLELRGDDLDRYIKVRQSRYRFS